MHRGRLAAARGSLQHQHVAQRLTFLVALCRQCRDAHRSSCHPAGTPTDTAYDAIVIAIAIVIAVL